MSLSLQFFRFLVVGAINTAFGYLVFAGLVLMGVGAVVALVATYIIGVVFNYFTTGRFVFPHAQRGAFVRFVLAYVVIYFFNLGLYKIVAVAIVNPLVVQALCVPIVAVFSFMLFRLHVFRGPTLSSHSAEDPSWPGR